MTQEQLEFAMRLHQELLVNFGPDEREPVLNWVIHKMRSEGPLPKQGGE